jgi:tetratricopeptide (TPR) repeat protein
MGPIRALRRFILAAILGFLVLAPGTGRAQTDPEKANRDRSNALITKGDLAGALAEQEQILTRSPLDVLALYQSARLNLFLHNLDAARGRAERLVKATGSSAAAWELMTQIAQSQGDLKRRDEAIDRLEGSIRSAIDPNIRRTSVFIREMLPVGTGFVAVGDYWDRGGSDYTRYQFSLVDPRDSPEIGLLLRTDDATTESWSSTALLPPEKQLFHLDMVDRADDGSVKVAVYEYYVGEPDFDTVNAKVMKILHGEAQPITGTPGSMAGILKP